MEWLWRMCADANSVAVALTRLLHWFSYSCLEGSHGAEEEWGTVLLIVGVPGNLHTKHGLTAAKFYQRTRMQRCWLVYATSLHWRTYFACCWQFPYSYFFHWIRLCSHCPIASSLLNPKNGRCIHFFWHRFPCSCLMGSHCYPVIGSKYISVTDITELQYGSEYRVSVSLYMTTKIDFWSFRATLLPRKIHLLVTLL